MGNQNCKFVYLRCLSSYTSQNEISIHKQACEKQEITSIKTSNAHHLYWKQCFQKIPLYFRIHAGFEADNDIDNSCMGNKTTKIFRRNPVNNGYYILSELLVF